MSRARSAGAACGGLHCHRIGNRSLARQSATVCRHCQLAASLGDSSFALGFEDKLRLDFLRRFAARVRINELDPLHFVDRVVLAHNLGRAVPGIRMKEVDAATNAFAEEEFDCRCGAGVVCRAIGRSFELVSRLCVRARCHRDSAALGAMSRWHRFSTRMSRA